MLIYSKLHSKSFDYLYKYHGSKEDLETSHQCLLYLKDVITRLPRQREEERSSLAPISFSTRELKMAEKVVDEEEFEFDERAVEGGLLHLFLFFFACIPFGLLSGTRLLALCSELA